MAKLDYKAVWIASVVNIDYPSKRGLDAAALKEELDAIVETCVKSDINCIIFQVRPTGDALYKSKIFPTSVYMVEKQGDPIPGGFDPLEYLIKTAHAKGIDVHAWINPYRITQGSELNPKHNLNSLSNNNPARIHPEYTVPYADGKLYYNPAMPEVRNLITDGIMEIVNNYDIDGIHFDDYFYPYPIRKQVEDKSVVVNYDDTYQYNQYANGMDKEDWRRENVNKLIKQCYDTIKASKPSVSFGVSPFAIWRNKSSDPERGSDTNSFESYSQLYADSVAWIEGGYVDYICPQIYWPTSHPTAPFKAILDWWDNIVDGTGVKLFVGHGVYRVETWEEPGQLTTQLQLDKDSKNCSAAVFFGYDKIRDNAVNCRDDIAAFKA